MVLEECHFTYGDYDSRKHNLVFGHFDTDEFTNMYGEVETRHIFNRRAVSFSYIGDNYEDAGLEIEIDIVNICGEPLTREERREVESALFHGNKYHKLYLDQDDDEQGLCFDIVNGEPKRLYLNCRLVSPRKIFDAEDRVIGYTCILECDHHMFWQDPISVVYDGELTTTITIDTDQRGYTYPELHVKGASGAFTFVNLTDDPARETKIEYDGDFDLIGNMNYLTRAAYEKFTTKYFPRLVNGENEIKITGSFEECTLVYQNSRFV